MGSCDQSWTAYPHLHETKYKYTCTRLMVLHSKHMAALFMSTCVH